MSDSGGAPVSGAPSVPTTYFRHRYGIFSSFALLAASQLDLFTTLKDGAKGAHALAALLTAKPDKLRILLDALVQAELLERRGDAYANTSEAQTFLVRGAPGYVGDWWRLDNDLWRAVLETAATLRSGEPQGWHDFNAMSDSAMADFFAGLHGAARASGMNLAKTYDFSRFRHLADIGGGSGGMALGACEISKELQATVIDLPRVTQVARGFIEDAGLGARIGVLPVDLVAGPPPSRSFDVAVMRSFIQVLSRDDARQALRNVGSIILPGGEIYIVGYILNDERSAPPVVVGYNLVFLNVYRDGEAYCAGEYRAWLEEAGFVDVSIQLGTIGAGMSLVTARIPD